MSCAMSDVVEGTGMCTPPVLSNSGACSGSDPGSVVGSLLSSALYSVLGSASDSGSDCGAGFGFDSGSGSGSSYCSDRKCFGSRSHSGSDVDY